MSGADPGGSRTVFRPSPLQALKGGGANAASTMDAMPPAPAPAPAPPPERPAPLAPSVETDRPPTGAGRDVLLAEGGAILALAAGMRGGRVRMPLPRLHRQATQVIADLDRAIQPLFPDDARHRARYALCATLDDIAQHLPGIGADGAEWARRSMVAQFFPARPADDLFWRTVDELLRAPRDNAELIAFYHACLAAGYEGSLRAAADGKRRLHEVAGKLQAALPQGGGAGGMSPNWRGEDAPVGKAGAGIQAALAAAVAAALLLVVYIVLRLLLLSSGAAPAVAVAAINPDGPLRLSRGGASVAALPPSAAATVLRGLLAPEIAKGALKVEEDISTLRIITAVPLFAAGSDRLDPGGAALIAGVGRALRSQPGTVTVEDHVAGGAASSLAFPDATALSTARADKAAATLKGELVDGARVTARGMGDTRPVAAATAPRGATGNDRVEIVLPRPS